MMYTKLQYRWVGFPGDDVLDIILVMAEVAAHSGFGDALLHPQLSNAFPDKIELHVVTSVS